MVSLRTARRSALGAAAAIGLMVAAGCAPVVPVPAPTRTMSTGPSDRPSDRPPAVLSISAAGQLCELWWMGCGAYVVLAEPAWALPSGWTPGPLDTRLTVEPSLSGPTLVTGVDPGGPSRLAPGRYRFVVVRTFSPDDKPSGYLESSVGCAMDAEVGPATREVLITIVLAANDCGIEVALDPPGPSPTPA